MGKEADDPNSRWLCCKTGTCITGATIKPQTLSAKQHFWETAHKENPIFSLIMNTHCLHKWHIAPALIHKLVIVIIFYQATSVHFVICIAWIHRWRRAELMLTPSGYCRFWCHYRHIRNNVTRGQARAFFVNQQRTGLFMRTDRLAEWAGRWALPSTISWLEYLSDHRTATLNEPITWLYVVRAAMNHERPPSQSLAQATHSRPRTRYK